MRMTVLLVSTLMVGCRSEEKTESQDTQGLTAIGDVDSMAAAWCAVLECREGFEAGFASVEACTDFYSNYWGNDSWHNNQRECFTDIEAVDACIVALEGTMCGGDTPAECVGFMACDDPDDTGAE